MRNIMVFILSAILYSCLTAGIVAAETKPPAEGGVLPGIVLDMPENSEFQQYLGIAGKQTFTIPEIKAEVVIIEIFSMY